MTDFFARLYDVAEKDGINIDIQKDVLLSQKTTFKIGGACDAALFPKTVEEFEWAHETVEKLGIPLFVMGRGSNLLVDDEGFRGAVIFTEKMNECTRDGNKLVCLAGASLTPLSRNAAKMGLAGLEFACGIPGSVGGAVIMNAGAYGGEMRDVVKSCTILTKNGLVFDYKTKEDTFSYRYSEFEKMGALVLGAVLELYEDDPEKIVEREEELLSRRREKQPLEYASAGSAFKRPEGYFAAKLIEDAGLKGYAVGGACVSEKHSGFVINRGGASCSDVMSVMNYVREKVRRDTGVVLCPEVRYLSPEGEKAF